MSPALAALFVLFNGQNLDGWKTLSGEWAVRDGAIVCVRPGAISSSFESDDYKLSFDYGLPGGKWYVHVGADLSGHGGRKYRLGEAFFKTPAKLPGHKINSRQSVSVTPEMSRGFIVFEAIEPGLEIRNIKATDRGFKSLFDGKTLKGWEQEGNPDNWYVENGAICTRNKGKSWLRTAESYDNFVLRLEYWLPAKGNSGIYLHAPLQGRVSQTGQEIQLLDDEGWKGRTKASQRNGSIYAGVAPEVEVPAPAKEWNAIEVLTQGKRIRTTLNGVQLYDVRLDDASKDAQLLRHPLSTRRLTGFIGLQDHSDKPRFRNIRIRVLPPESQPAG